MSSGGPLNVVISAVVGAVIAGVTVIGGVSAYNSGDDSAPQNQLFSYANA